MKKFILIFILFLLAAGAAGYFGWVQIDPGTFGIAHSTITGTVPHPLESGRIYWFWQKLIPRSFYLYIVKNEPFSVKIETVYPLPGHEQLSDFGSFELEVLTTIEYRINFETAVILLKDGVLTNFEGFFKDRVSSQIAEIISTFVLENMIRSSREEEEIHYTALDNLRESFDEYIDSSIQYFHLKNGVWNITFRNIPQLELYNEALNRYFSYIKTVYKFKEEELDRKKEYQIKLSENDAEIDRLRKYGELLTQYPELLKYFYVQKFSEQADVLVLPQEEATGFPRMLEPDHDYPKRHGSAEPLKPLPEEPYSRPGERIQPDSPGGAPEVEFEEGEFQPEKDLSEEADSAKEKWYESLRFWKFLGRSKNDI